MFLNGDKIYTDSSYRELIDSLFAENAKLTQDIMVLISKIPFKKLRGILFRAVRSNRCSRIISAIALHNINKTIA